ncbi:hypothetical protein LIT32_27215 (plasmid) [Bacillus sp. CMF21]|nr:hypothetical protein LIT32_27215 [Bacillus sp. CMF21]
MVIGVIILAGVGGVLSIVITTLLVVTRYIEKISRNRIEKGFAEITRLLNSMRES